MAYLGSMKPTELSVNDAICSPELFNEILVAVTSGGSLAAVCRDKHISYKGVLAWINDDDDLQTRYVKALEIRAQHAKDEIISEMFSLLRADVTDAFTDGGDLKLLSDMPPELRRLIGQIEYREIFEMMPREDGGRGTEKVHVGTLHKIKFWDRPKATETFMRHLRMLDTSVNLEHKHTLAELLLDDTKKG